MKKQLYTLLVIGLLFFIIGCQKESDNTTTPAPTKTELITKSSWSFDRATSSGTDISGFINACYKDNVVTFTSSTNGTVNEGANVCASPAPSTFTWSFQNSETVLSLSAPLFSGGTGNFNIVALTATSLAISQDVIIPPSSTSSNVIFYYKH